MLLYITRTFGLMVVNSSFLKKEVHLVTFRNLMAKTQIDFLLLTKADMGLCRDCKVILRGNLLTHNKLLVMDLEIKKEGKKRDMDDWPRIKWGSLTMASVFEIGES